MKKNNQELKRRSLVSHYMEVDGLKIHTRVAQDSAPRDALAVVLVHGMVVSSRYLIPTAEMLAPHYHVYAPDIPGFGKSEKPSQVLDVAQQAEFLARWMDAWGIEQAVMLGNSMGCQVISEFAVRYPNRIQGTVLIGPTMDPHAQNSPQQLLRWSKQGMQWLVQPGLERFKLFKIHLIDYMAAGIPRAMRTARLGLQHRIDKNLPHMQTPTLVVRGKRDPITPQYWAEEAAELLPRGRLAVIPGAGHVPHFSAPLELTRVTRAFIEQLVESERVQP
jgi:2-hydroxy-6-oxonona-2,4-dienedioate hydrolase